MNTKATRHLINWKNWEDREIADMLKLAKDIKERPEAYNRSLKDKTLIMLFQKTSTRTRVSFEAGMTEMGGHATFLDWMTTNFALTEIKYESAYLSRNSHIIMARMKKHEDLLELEKGASIPLINGCCNLYHPCQSLADMLTIFCDRESVEDARLTYIGAHNNVANSLMAVCAALDVHLTLVCPVSPEETVEREYKEKLVAKGLLTETLDRFEAVKNAEYVYTDTWLDMEFFNNPDYQDLKRERIELMIDYQVNHKLLKDSQAKVMHDMPIHPGYEISGEMVEDPRAIIIDQAENRLHAQKAIMLTLLSNS